MGKMHGRTLEIVFALLLCMHLHGQTVIADGTYSPVDWSVTVVTTFDASENHTQHLTNGNPDAYRYMEHILSAPPGPADLATIEVTHIFNGDVYLALDAIDHIDFSEDIRLLSLPWEQAFIRSYPAIRQSGKFFRTTSQYLTVIADTMWMSETLTGLTANDFVALDGSDDKPDFSNQGDFLFFGFWRISSRGATIPPFPADEDLIYQHGSDNFTVTIHNTPPENQPPVARADDYLYLDYFFNSDKTLYVLNNDSDPEGDLIQISNVDEPAFGGIIESSNDTTITYSYDNPLSSFIDSDFFLYRITDGLNESLNAFVTMYFCLCPLECIGLFLNEPPDSAVQNVTVGHDARTKSPSDTLDIELFRRFRDEVLLPTQSGAGFVDLYYRFAPEVMPLLLIQQRELGRQAFNTLGLMQGPLRNLLDGDGSEMITQELIDSVNLFIDHLMVEASDSLRSALESELTQLCPLEDLVGLTIAQAALSAICDSMNTSVENQVSADEPNVILRQNFPNPFTRGTASQSTAGHSTQISYALPQSTHVQLMIYDFHGRRIRTLADEDLTAGEKSVHWDGTDDNGHPLNPGIYYYQLKTFGFNQTKKMVLID